ncbi:unnamed protein product [Phytophthora fragariaefolia]|uniref:Unnamed protein product n=1 Tax=Phytophthora fragariaefolia TaxID=1490495 RepID=A0A9W6YF12_9STRA|nr:unnamed protein product [Phytophthora fragariaefolia]
MPEAEATLPSQGVAVTEAGGGERSSSRAAGMDAEGGNNFRAGGAEAGGDRTPEQQPAANKEALKRVYVFAGQVMNEGAREYDTSPPGLERGNESGTIRKPGEESNIGSSPIAETDKLQQPMGRGDAAVDSSKTVNGSSETMNSSSEAADSNNRLTTTVSG